MEARALALLDSWCTEAYLVVTPERAVHRPAELTPDDMLDMDASLVRFLFSTEADRALEDAWLMEMLPHLTLEQIDEIDLPRYMRAWEARELVQRATRTQGQTVDVPNWETEEEQRTWQTLHRWLQGKAPIIDVAKLDQEMVARMMDRMRKRG